MFTIKVGPDLPALGGKSPEHVTILVPNHQYTWPLAHDEPCELCKAVAMNMVAEQQSPCGLLLLREMLVDVADGDQVQQGGRLRPVHVRHHREEGPVDHRQVVFLQ